MLELFGNIFESALNGRVARRFGGDAKLPGTGTQISDLVHFVTALLAKKTDCHCNTRFAPRLRQSVPRGLS